MIDIFLIFFRYGVSFAADAFSLRDVTLLAFFAVFDSDFRFFALPLFSFSTPFHASAGP
jgi:hypothetical protein